MAQPRRLAAASSQLLPHVEQVAAQCLPMSLLLYPRRTSSSVRLNVSSARRATRRCHRRVEGRRDADMIDADAFGEMVAVVDELLDGRPGVVFFGDSFIEPDIAGPLDQGPLN